MMDVQFFEVSRRVDQLLSAVLEYSLNRFGKKVIDEAWSEYTSWLESELPSTTERLPPLFLAWLAFDWAPVPAHPAFQGRSKDLVAGILTNDFLEHQKDKLDEQDQILLRSSLQRPLSFFEVKECRGFEIVLHDLILNRELVVTHPWKAQQFTRSDIILAAPCGFVGLQTIISCRRAIPSKYRQEIVDLGAWARQSPTGHRQEDTLHQCHPEMFELFWKIQHRLVRGQKNRVQSGYLLDGLHVSSENL